MSPQCTRKVHAVEESTTASQVGSQDTIMVGSVESYFDVGRGAQVRTSAPWMLPIMCVQANPLTLRSMKVLK